MSRLGVVLRRCATMLCRFAVSLLCVASLCCGFVVGGSCLVVPFYLGRNVCMCLQLLCCFGSPLYV